MGAEAQPGSPPFMNPPFQGKKLMITQIYSIKTALASFFSQVIENKAPWVNIHGRKRRKDGREGRGQEVGRRNTGNLG